MKLIELINKKLDDNKDIAEFEDVGMILSSILKYFSSILFSQINHDLLQIMNGRYSS